MARKNKPQRPSLRRISYHEAGHAVLSAALNDSPHLIRIQPQGGKTLGFARYCMEAPPERMIQVHLAGFAAEHIYFGRQPKGMEVQLNLIIMAVVDPRMSFLIENREGSDEHLAIKSCLEMNISVENLKSEALRFYKISIISLKSVWPSVQAVARALLKHRELDNAQFRKLISAHSIYSPVFAVQKQFGIL